MRVRAALQQYYCCEGHRQAIGAIGCPAMPAPRQAAVVVARSPAACGHAIPGDLPPRELEQDSGSFLAERGGDAATRHAWSGLRPPRAPGPARPARPTRPSTEFKAYEPRTRGQRPQQSSILKLTLTAGTVGFI